MSVSSAPAVLIERFERIQDTRSLLRHKQAYSGMRIMNYSTAIVHVFLHSSYNRDMRRQDNEEKVQRQK